MKTKIEQICKDALTNLPAFEINDIKPLLRNLGIKVYGLKAEEIENIFNKVFK